MSIFEKFHRRTGTRSVKWDLSKTLFGSDEVLPMWVADMDFTIPQPITDALVERAKHGIFGYTAIDEQINESVSNWLARRHQWKIQHEWLSFSPGVISSLHMAIQALTKPDDSVLIQTPVYPPFYDIVKKHDRNLVTNALNLVDNHYEIDFEDFEQKLQQGVKAFILCNPHNPVGRVWTKAELRKMAELCLTYDVLIFSDEIHADLIYSDYSHTPIASLTEEINKQTLTFMSPTKTFNIAGLHTSYVITADKEKRDKVNNCFEKQGIKMLNTMGVVALEAAYNDGEGWLEELRSVLEEHKHILIDRLSETDLIEVIPPEGTYLVWLDCRKMGLDNKELKHFMQNKAKVGLNDGLSFGNEGEGFMRINIACPRQTLEEGINRIITALRG